MPRISGQQSLEGTLIDWCLEQPVPSPRLPVALLSKAQKAAELQRVVASEATLAAYKAELVLGLADDSPDVEDPPPGTPGARTRGWAPDGEFPGVSEFFTAELSAVLNCGRGTASHLAARAWTYRENLPATWAALREGVLDEPRAKVLADVLAHVDPDISRSIEADLLPQAHELSIGRLKKLALAMLVRRSPGAVDQRREEAQRCADVRTYPSPLEGMSTLAVDLSPEEAATCYGIVDSLAMLAKKEGDPRPIGQLRAAMLSALVRQPGDPAR